MCEVNKYFKHELQQNHENNDPMLGVHFFYLPNGVCLCEDDLEAGWYWHICDGAHESDPIGPEPTLKDCMEMFENENKPMPKETANTYLDEKKVKEFTVDENYGPKPFVWG